MNATRMRRDDGTRRAIVRCAAILVGLAALAAGAGAQPAKRAPAGSGSMEYKAKAMLDRGLELLEMRQEDRAVKLIGSIPQMFPKAKVRFRAHLVLGRHQLQKGRYDLAIIQFLALRASEEADHRAEALYSLGICYYSKGEYDKAFISLRQVTTEYPGSVYANEAFYYIGQCHFKLGRWAKAVEALQLVGTSVPLDAEGQATGEAGQRLFIRIHDKDLVVLMRRRQELKITVTSGLGDSEQVPLAVLGQGGEHFIGSIQTALGAPKAGDGVLQIAGRDLITATYADENTESGQRNQKVLARIRMVSTGVVGFTDGAYREYTQGVFGEADCFLRVKDLDRDTSDGRDAVVVTVQARYKVRRTDSDTGAPAAAPADAGMGEDLAPVAEEWVLRDQVTVRLTETAEHSGIFVGKIVPKIARAATDVRRGDATLSGMKGDQLLCSYTDDQHILGPDPRTVQATAQLLIGQIQDVKIEHRVVDSLELKARKNLIEARIFLKLGGIFKDVGLVAKASEKADQGLERVEEVIRSGLKAGLDRTVIEEAFQVKWELLLVQDKLSQAIGVCQALTRLFPDSSLVDQALLKIGIAKMRGEKPREAIGIFSGILRLKQSPLKADAQFHIAKVYEQEAIDQAAKRPDTEPNFSRAILAYQKCADSYPDSPFAGESLEKIAAFYIQTEDYARAISLMERVFQDYPDASFLDRMLMAWAEAAKRMGKVKVAREKCNLLLRDYPGSQLAGRAQALLKEMKEE